MNKILQFFTILLVVGGCAMESNTTLDENEIVAGEGKDSEYEEIYIYKTPYTEKTEAKKETSKPLFNLETSLRCVVDVKNKDVITTIPFKYDAFDLYRLNSGDELPRFEVTGYTFNNKPADVVFRDLLKDADIKVVAADEFYPEISADKITGELTKIMNSIAQAADLYYTYNAKKKTLSLHRYGQLVFEVPNKELVLPALDALQGSGVQDISVDWADNTLLFEGDKYQEMRAAKLIELFDKEPKLAFYDVTMFHIEPVNADKQIDWTALINTYGTDNIKSGEQGTIGKILVTSHIVNQKTLISLLSAQARVYQVGQGKFSVPNKWRSRFDIWHCGNSDISAKKMAILAQVEINDNKIISQLGIDTVDGEVASFDAINRLDENIVIFGIPSKSLGYADEGETIFFLSPKIVDVIKEN